jgi:small-conductance mechanosensitive channel
LVEVPSSTITAQPVINYSRAGLRRLTTQLTLERNVDIAGVTGDLRDVIRRASGVAASHNRR